MFDDIINAVKSAKSYLLTLTTRELDKDENNLHHYHVRQDFPTDDIIPSIDNCVRQLGLRSEKPVAVVRSVKQYEERKPLKIAVITHFNRCPDSYSPCKAVKSQIAMLMEHGHQVVFFTQEGSQVDIGCEMRPVVPKFSREKNVINEEVKKKFIDILREQLTSDFDIAITHDLYLDDCITYREAIKECGVPIKWLHWARSGVGHLLDFKMPNSRYVYMNYADVGPFARAIGIKSEEVRVVFNDKDPAFFLRWHKTTKYISDTMRLWEKDVIQTYPICTTRMDAKGLNSVIKIFGALKQLGNNVALVIVNANGRRRPDEIQAKLKFASEECGLVDKQDIVFTSTLANDEHPIHSETPYEVVAQLFQASNLFVFPTIAEVCSNILLEAAMTKNLLVLNQDLLSLFDFVDKDAVLKYPFTSRFNMHYEGRGEDEIAKLAKQIHGQLMTNKTDRQFRHTWRTHSREYIYREQFEPLLYENYAL